MSNSFDELFKYGRCEIKFKNRIEPYSKTNVVVVGCGGTGSRLIPLLAQFIQQHNLQITTNPRNNCYFKHKLKLVLIDQDDFSSSNLSRQACFSFEVGKNKAEVMASRMSAYFGIDIKIFKQKYDNSLLNSCPENLIIFDCTDNLNARKSIEELSIYRSNRIIISCGNEEDFGQVLVSCDKDFRSDYYLYNSYISKFDNLVEMINNPKHDNIFITEFLPSLLMLYKDFKDTEKPSCDRIQLQNDQSMPINSLVANIAFNAFYDIMSNKPLKYNMVTCNIHNTFDTKTITHPKAMFDLYAKAMFGAYDPKFVLDNFMGVKNLFISNAYNADITFIDDNIEKYGTLMLPFLIQYQSTNYRLNGAALEKIVKYINDLNGVK